MHANPASKVDIATIAEKKRITGRIAKVLLEGDHFILVGHKSPDEDCIASMVALGLVASTLGREVALYISGLVHQQFSYLLSICAYNGIRILKEDSPLPFKAEAIIALDTPKPAMLDLSPAIEARLAQGNILRMEIDHHLGADSSYFGDEGYCLVCAASSASELVGYLALKLDRSINPGCIEGEDGLLARNLVLAVLTGIIADSRMGQYLKTRKERWFYKRFSELFDVMLTRKTSAGSGNFASKEEVFEAIAALSSKEEECYRVMMRQREFEGRLGFILLDEAKLAALHDEFGEETITTIAKAAADALAEESGYLGLIAYPDHPAVSELLQFRLRRSQDFQSLDLRDVLAELGASNGGGHPGAVGFRFAKSEVADFMTFAREVTGRIIGILQRYP